MRLSDLDIPAWTKRRDGVFVAVSPACKFSRPGQTDVDVFGVEIAAQWRDQERGLVRPGDSFCVTVRDGRSGLWQMHETLRADGLLVGLALPLYIQQDEAQKAVKPLAA